VASLTVISGGQTGADRTALEVARALGIETGGWVPLGWRTEDGADTTLAAFGLRETPGCISYRVRTRWNVRDSDVTVLFGDTTTPGCALTKRACVEYGKSFIENPTVDMFVSWLIALHPSVVNVAGNRRSTNPHIEPIVRETLRPALEEYVECLTRPSPVESTPIEEQNETAEAIAMCAAGTSPAWVEYMVPVARYVIERQPFLSTEPIWLEVKRRGGEPPTRTRKSIGPLMRQFQEWGWITPVNETERAKQMRHGAPLNLWRSLLYKDAHG
jgi:hypothetical protein